MVSIFLPYFAILGIPMIAAVAGALSRGDERPRHWAIVGSALVGVAFAGLAATAHESGVPVEDAVVGVVATGLVLGFLPPYLFFRLGHALREHRIVLGLACAVTAVPLVYFYLLGLLFMLEVVHCPPDAYECPV
jgi:hypothetical protein